MLPLIDAVNQIMPAHCIITDDAGVSAYCADTSLSHTPRRLIVEPENVAQIQALVDLANRLKVSLYPISSGHNWGYGTAAPVDPAAIVVSLKRMNKIRFDAALGLLTIEPGVTQQSLADYFQAHNYPFMVPTTGAGPNCSLIGNALERGYGLTPITDHFAAVMGLCAVLANGEIYRSPLLENGFAPLLKWGLGPYLDGLFSQGNLGIVTEMTLLVERKPEVINAFICQIKPAQFEQVIPLIRQLLTECRGNIAGINLMHSKRVAMMNDDFAHPFTEDKPMWVLVGTLYGTKRHAKATRALVKQRLSAVTRAILFISPRKAAFIAKLSSLVPKKGFAKLKQQMAQLKNIMGLFEGVPADVSLRLAYYKNRDAEPAHDLDPALDGCGLLWYSPIVPIKASQAKRYVAFVTRTCRKYGIEAAFTFTSLSPITFDCTLPILYRRNSGEETMALACYHELVEKGRKLGFTPYRLNSTLMPDSVMRGNTYNSLASTIKRAVDNNQIISPGRYE